MRRVVALCLAFALVASGCDFIEVQFAETVKEIEQEKGLDITSPTQIAAASLFAGEEEQEQLNAAKSVQRILNEQRGDDHMGNGDPRTAREAYERALSWTRSDDQRNRRAIEEKIAASWIDSSANDQSARTQRGLAGAYDTLGRLAGDERDDRVASRLLTRRAMAANNLGLFKESCSHVIEARSLDPSNREAEYLYQRNDC